MISNFPLNILEQPSCTISRFADDTELSGAVTHLKDGMLSRGRDLDQLKKWAHGSIVRFNRTKVLHLGWGNP